MANNEVCCFSSSRDSCILGQIGMAAAKTNDTYINTKLFTTYIKTLGGGEHVLQPQLQPQLL